ncbi:MAG TPA: hypothetical protein VHT30_10060 [Acidimicrobiales bacterium]|jgi:hypothetical protein|nr:hypothetical protein [Acidimicrobiales bacterium]
MSGKDVPTTGDPNDPPWIWTKRGGLNVAMPMPAGVVEKLGGADEVELRLRRVLTVHTEGTALPAETVQRLTELYTELLTTLETTKDVE